MYVLLQTETIMRHKQICDLPSSTSTVRNSEKRINRDEDEGEAKCHRTTKTSCEATLW